MLNSLVEDFLLAIKPSLRYELQPLQDGFGPAITDRALRAIVVSEPLPTAVAARVEEPAPIPALAIPPAACGTAHGSGISTAGVQLLPVATLQCMPAQETPAPISPTSDSEPALSVLKV